VKKFLLPLLAVVAISFSAAAQTTPPQKGDHPRRSPQEMAQHQAKRLSKELSLTADQSTKVEQIMAARAQEMQALRADASTRPTREQMQANRAKYSDQLKQVLTPEQFAKYTTLAANRHHGHGMKDGKLKAKDGKLKLKANSNAS
jgi:Spy/CpxP family protein refolding chaperone